jgi:protein-tyrosine-phosphatase
MKHKTRVLFLCTHNAARSQMAEALLRHIAGHSFEVSSAGLEPTEVHPLTFEVLRERGVETASTKTISADTTVSPPSWWRTGQRRCR